MASSSSSKKKNNTICLFTSFRAYGNLGWFSKCCLKRDHKESLRMNSGGHFDHGPIAWLRVWLFAADGNPISNPLLLLFILTLEYDLNN